MTDTKKVDVNTKKIDAVIDALVKCEVEIRRRMGEHAKARTALAEGHPDHAAHNNHAERARVRLGAALGYVVSAQQELDAHESIHAEAVAAHAEAERLKKEEAARKAKEAAK